MLLDQWMREKRWTANALAKATGLARLTIKNIMERKTDISLRTAYILQDFTKGEVTLQELYLNTESRNEQ